MLYYIVSNIVVEREVDCSVTDICCIVSQTMAASKRANAIPSAFVARQSLNDEELVSMSYMILCEPLPVLHIHSRCCLIDSNDFYTATQHL